MQIAKYVSTKCINTYAKYVSIKMLHTCHAMQFVAILCHTRLHINKNIAIYCNNIMPYYAYQQNARNKYVSRKCHKHICRVRINQNVAYLARNAIYSNTMPYYCISTNIAKYCNNTMAYYCILTNDCKIM